MKMDQRLPGLGWKRESAASLPTVTAVGTARLDVYDAWILAV